MAGRTLFSRVARYGHSTAAEQRENRLTEICAALFESPFCQGLARNVTLGWLGAALRDDESSSRIELASRASFAAARRQLADGDPLDWACDVATQVPVYGERIGFVDLELRFYAVTGSDTEVRLWIEAKNGGDPHDHQLRLYADEWAKRGAIGGVLLLAPRSDYTRFMKSTPTELDERVAQLTWEQTARLFQNHESSTGIGRFLVQELCAFLKEEKLMDQELTPIHHLALANYSEAVTSLLAACDVASRWVAENWTPPSDRKWASRGQLLLDMWDAYDVVPADMPPQDWRGWGWGWNLFADASQLMPEGRRGAPCFIAGIRKDQEGIDDAAWATKLRDAGFEIWPRWGQQVRRVAYPEEVLIGRTLDAQGQSLGRWIVESFRRVASIGPPSFVTDG